MDLLVELWNQYHFLYVSLRGTFRDTLKGRLATLNFK
jgi:hypothetical protein